MTGFDDAVLGVADSSVLLGLLRGAVRAVFALAGGTAAFLAARAYTASLAGTLPASLSSEALRCIIVCALLFFSVRLACWPGNRRMAQACDGLAKDWGPPSAAPAAT